MKLQKRAPFHILVLTISSRYAEPSILHHVKKTVISKTGFLALRKGYGAEIRQNVVTK